MGWKVFFWSDRGGGLGGSDIWTVTRPDQLTPFTNASAIALSSSTTSDDYDPWLATDGLHVYFTTSDSDLSMGSYDIVVASRASLNAPFGRPVPVAGINSTSVDDNPTLSSDGLLLVFSSERPGGAGSGDLYYAQRASTTDAFSEPLPLVDLNTPYEDYEPCLTRQGELYFSSNRPGGSGADDIYRTRIVPVM